MNDKTIHPITLQMTKSGNRCRIASQFFTLDSVEYLYYEGKIIEIAGSYPDVETALAALRSRVGRDKE